MDDQQLKEAFEKLPRPSEPPPPHTWERHRYELHNHVNTEPIDKFLHWSTIVATMFVGDFDNTQKEMAALLGASQNWRHAVTESWVGDPPAMKDYPFTSGNLVHQAYHISQLFPTGSGAGSLKSIVEFGGGYGAMRYLFSRLGFNGTYTIYDTPEFSLLQEYYCSQLDLSTVYQHVVADRFTPPKPGADLLLGIYSLSEVGEDLMRAFLITAKAKRVLIAHQNVYIKREITKAIRELCYSMTDYEWQFFPMLYWPTHGYIVGEAKDHTPTVKPMAKAAKAKKEEPAPPAVRKPARAKTPPRSKK